MTHSPLVSVILPTYNRAEYLQRSISSVLNQTYPFWELIIWDDGSTDNTEEIVKSFNDGRIKYHFDNNHGVSYARNRAIEMALGKYLAFLDSDDLWDDEKLFVQVGVMDAYPQIDLLLTNFLNINFLTKEKNRVFEENSCAMKLVDINQIDNNLVVIKGGLLESLSVENFIATDSVIIRRELLNRIGYFNEGLRNSEDFELWWRMGLAGICFAYLSKVCLTRYKPPGSLSSPSILGCENRIKALDLCLHASLIRGRKDLVPYLNPLYRNAWQNFILFYHGNGDKKGVLKAFFQSMRYGVNFGSIRLMFESFLVKKNIQRIKEMD